MASRGCKLLLYSCLFLWTLKLAVPVASASDFSVTEVSREEQHSRSYENATDLMLLRASTAVLQDIGFQVTEVERSAGLIVALSPVAAAGHAGHSLTVNLVPVEGGDHRLRVRVSMVSCCMATTGDVPGHGDYSDFYQAFFKQLRRELFRHRSLQ